MANFRKNEDCPTSQDLLDYQLGDMSLGDGAPIRKHLAHCEFCSAEVEFYENYPPNLEPDEPASVVAMPSPLYELAEALLIKKADDNFFDRLMEGDEDISLSNR